MSDRILVPLPDGRWLALERDAFDTALIEGARLLAPPRHRDGAQDTGPLLDVEALATALGDVPASRLSRLAREQRIPSTRVGRSYRFELSAVKRALANGGAA